jgi:hypothetical protein
MALKLQSTNAVFTATALVMFIPSKFHAVITDAGVIISPIHELDVRLRIERLVVFTRDKAPVRMVCVRLI